ncbi:hypothetical protein BKA15_001648 [Microlunatus parietis]|uniref:Uncharacterized protein n=1 Tax=Microlunatus parietis TaxID=682979 RepID=A0A7Y9L821_9ACTN|nr:hypothetical protein [Microlunatus parietis]
MQVGTSLASSVLLRCNYRVRYAEQYSGAGGVQTYRAMSQLERAGFIQEITGRKRDRIWAASDLLAELEDLDRRIQESMRD